MSERDAIYDPILPQDESAEYLGFRGKYKTRSLRRLNLERAPMPGRGQTTRYGYRLSVLNAYLASLADPNSRKPPLRRVGSDPGVRRSRGRFVEGRRVAS